MSNVGCRIFLKIPRLDREIVKQFQGLPVANIADEMNRFFCMDARIKPFNNIPLVGTAFTVKTRVADNLMLHKAIELAQPGDVIVVDAQGDLSNAVTGEIMMTQAEVKGLAGVVIDGAIRDAEAMKSLNMPVYAAGIQPKGPYKDGPGEINVPVCCGGVMVNPGDIIVGDADGVVVINPNDAYEVLQKAKDKMAKEQSIIKGIREKLPRDKSWVDSALERIKCEIVDDYYK